MLSVDCIALSFLFTITTFVNRKLLKLVNTIELSTTDYFIQLYGEELSILFPRKGKYSSFVHQTVVKQLSANLWLKVKLSYLYTMIANILIVLSQKVHCMRLFSVVLPSKFQRLVSQTSTKTHLLPISHLIVIAVDIEHRRNEVHLLFLFKVMWNLQLFSRTNENMRSYGNHP